MELLKSYIKNLIKTNCDTHPILFCAFNIGEANKYLKMRYFRYSRYV